MCEVAQGQSLPMCNGFGPCLNHLVTIDEVSQYFCKYTRLCVDRSVVRELGYLVVLCEAASLTLRNRDVNHGNEVANVFSFLFDAKDM